MFEFIFTWFYIYSGPQTRYVNVWAMMNRIHEKIANTLHGDFRR